MKRDIVRKIYLLPVKGYQKFLSPFMGGQCLYSPSCSHYFTDAVLKHGIIKGTILGSARICRCSRYYTGGLDEVPQNFSFKEIRSTNAQFRRRKRK